MTKILFICHGSGCENAVDLTSFDILARAAARSPLKTIHRIVFRAFRTHWRSKEVRPLASLGRDDNVGKASASVEMTTLAL